MNKSDDFFGLLVTLLVFLGYIVWKNNTSESMKKEIYSVKENKKVLCIHCNEKVLLDSKFCSNCGKKALKF